ncbi:hypothetical protein CBR_g12239 [Chara braunii]|uniref:Uncharacterized protein n=1 Tax=Chara braunii TaxID=69332 RepID=A0A388KRJ7_CHABU|nr:hypothetical protein CBR_g12239 [Chara braunii]|eukprot:GBG72667.1 hypothetical protein CBR_g12239 [Chara braunii]
MFWRVTGLATTSPVDIILDRDSYTLEELLDEDDLIQECKALSTRLLTFLRAKPQVLQLLRYVVEEPSPEADEKRVFKYPFVSCEVFTCEIDSVFNTLLEDDELMGLLFSFVEADRPHGPLLAGYFSKVVICLLVRRTDEVMTYLQAHQDLLKKLVDLIGITSIMEVLMRLVGADEQILMFHPNSIQWLVDTDILEMIIDKLSPQYSADVHANAAEVLSAVARTPSVLSSQLASSRLVGKLFKYVLEDKSCRSAMVNSLSVCITLLDPKRVANAAEAGVARGIHVPDNLQSANPDEVDGMLQSLGDLLALLDITGDETVLPTTYGQLKPPLGIHRLKIVEFISILLQTGSEMARVELIRLGAIQMVLKLFFQFPYNNLLHHQVEIIIATILDCGNPGLIDNLMRDCDLVTRVLDTDADPIAPDSAPEYSSQDQHPKRPPNRVGNIGHITKICNKLVQVACSNSKVDAYLKANERWAEWQSSVLQKRNQIEDIFKWACGRPPVEDRHGDSDEDEFGPKDFDIPMGGNMSRDAPYRYGVEFDPDDAEEAEALTSYQRHIEDVFFEEAAEGVMRTLRIDEHDSDEEDMPSGPTSSSPHARMRVEDSDDSDDEENPSPGVAAAAAAAGVAAVSATDSPVDLFAVHAMRENSNPGWCAFTDEERLETEASVSATSTSPSKVPVSLSSPPGSPTQDNHGSDRNNNSTLADEIALPESAESRDGTSVPGDFDDVIVEDQMDTGTANASGQQPLVSSAQSESMAVGAVHGAMTDGPQEDCGPGENHSGEPAGVVGKNLDMDLEGSVKVFEVVPKDPECTVVQGNAAENNPFGNDIFGGSSFQAVPCPADAANDTPKLQRENSIEGKTGISVDSSLNVSRTTDEVDPRYNDTNFWRSNYLKDEEMT